jgi:hypothetical protein
MAKASQLTSQGCFDFTPIKDHLDLFYSPELNELTVGLHRLRNMLKQFMLSGLVEERLKRKVAAATALIREARRLNTQGQFCWSEELQLMRLEAEQRIREFVGANNEFCRKYPKGGKKPTALQKEMQELVNSLGGWVAFQGE